MFELAGLSAFLDILQKGFGLIDKRKDQKRRLFEEIVEPIHTELRVVVGEYFQFFRGCRDEFQQTAFENWEAVLIERKRKREEIILARERVLGIVSPFLDQERDQGDVDELLFVFATAIEKFFYSSDKIPDDVTWLTSLFDYIDYEVQRGDSESRYDVIVYIQTVLGDLERTWREISAAYGKLRVFCLS